MLSIAVARNADYYTRLAQSAYYTNAPEAPGMWYGAGAERLNLTGEISDFDAFKKVFQGYDQNGEKLVQNAGKENRKNAWDLTFSAPKSFSALWAVGSEKERARLESIERRAIEAALKEAGEHLVTRTGRDGVNRETCELVFALFPHSTSRSEEPQRHTHCLLMNVGVRADGKTSALETADLFRMKMTLGAIYRAELSRLMKEELNLSFERVNRSIELLGRDEKLCDFWSTRSKIIDFYMRENGLEGAKEAARACTETRSKKDMEKSQEEHLATWKTEAANMGHSYQSLYQTMRRETLIEKAKDPHFHLSDAEKKEVVKEGLIKAVKERLFKEHSSFTHIKLFQTVAEEAQVSGLTTAEIKEVTSTIKQSLTHLYTEKNGLSHYTTKETLELERKFLRNIKALSTEESHIVSAKTRSSFLVPELSDEQKLAFLHVTEPGQLKIVEGLAGAGKTTFLRQANRAWEKDGYTTIGVSLAAVAAENLQKEAQIQDSNSLAKFFYGYEKGTVSVDQKTVIVLDEAAMVGTHDLKKLTDICLSTGAKTVWVGDRNQLQAIDPGGAFAGAADRIGKAELKEIWRQRGEHLWGREAVYNAAKGAVTESLSKLHEKGKINFLDSRREAKEALIEAWAIGKEDSLKETLILTSTTSDAESLNHLAQDVLLKEGKLKLTDPSFPLKESYYFKGDRIIFKENSKSIGVKNGYRGQITDIAKSGLVTVELDSGGRRHFHPDSYDKISLGYAHTTHLAQGQTKNKTFILVDEGMIDREMFYVQISRQRDDVQLFINSEGEEQKEAYNTLLKRISKSNGEVLAHDLKRKLEKEEHTQEKEREAQTRNPRQGIRQGY